jgi:hypothetical protein
MTTNPNLAGANVARLAQWAGGCPDLFHPAGTGLTCPQPVSAEATTWPQRR